MGGKQTLTRFGPATTLNIMTELLDQFEPPPPEAISMHYELGQAGWASFSVALGEREFTIPDFGNMTDGLGDILRAALLVVTGASYAQVIFDGEPVRWGLAVVPAGLDDTGVSPTRICRLMIKDGGAGALTDAGYSNEPVWRWPTNILLEGHVRSDDLGAAVHQMAQTVREEFDDQEYRERWGHYGSPEGFPLRALQALQKALATPEYRR